MPPRADSPLARAGLMAGGFALVVVGVASLPVPLFPSFPTLLLGVVLLARASPRARRWLARQPWLERALGRVKNPRTLARLRNALGLDA
jgi:uncharacterized membrane protein YbaN (DUF454 family)